VLRDLRKITKIESRRDWAVYERVAALSESTPYEIGAAWANGSNAGTPRQAAGEMIGAGYVGLCLLAHAAMNDRTRRFYRAMTPEAGTAAGAWIAHAFLDELAGRGTNGVQQGQTKLRACFPLGKEAEGARSEIGPLLERGEGRADTAMLGVAIVLGRARTENLPFFQQLAGASPARLLNSLLLEKAWTQGARAMFKLVDPDGYQQWEESANEERG
jgi:hypothetical protein